VLTNVLADAKLFPMLKTTEFDSVLRALADPTRRGLYERVIAAEEITVGGLTHGSGVSQGAVSQHLKALKKAGLVSERPEGRNVFYRANPQGLEPMLEWMTRYAVFWSKRLDGLERLLRLEDTRNPSVGEKK
jgi:DNA-binding transcriptional ArsR family regulator